MFKKGDKVVAVTDYPENKYKRINKGDIGVVIDPNFDSLVLVEFPTGHEEVFEHRIRLIDKAKEDTKDTISSWLKENAWYIAVNGKQEFLAAVKWLEEHGELPQISDTWVEGAEALRSSDIADHTYIRTDMECIDIEHKEVVLDFKTIVEGVTLPEAPKKTEQQAELKLKLEELEATIQKAQQEIQQLKEMK